MDADPNLKPNYFDNLQEMKGPAWHFRQVQTESRSGLEETGTLFYYWNVILDKLPEIKEYLDRSVNGEFRRALGCTCELCKLYVALLMAQLGRGLRIHFKKPKSNEKTQAFFMFVEVDARIKHKLRVERQKEWVLVTDKEWSLEPSSKAILVVRGSRLSASGEEIKEDLYLCLKSDKTLPMTLSYYGNPQLECWRNPNNTKTKKKSKR